MCKIDASSRSSRPEAVTTAPNLTDEQKDKAVAALLADVLNSIDRAVASAVKSKAGVASAPTETSATPRRGDVAASR